MARKKIKKKSKYMSSKELDAIDKDIINSVNEDPKIYLNACDNMLAELKYVLELLKNSNEGSILPYDNCKVLLEISFFLDYSLEAFNYNYFNFNVPTAFLEMVKNKCYNGLKVFEEIKEIQTKNIDNPLFNGLESVISLDHEKTKRPIAFYSSKKFEDTIYLRQTYKKSKKQTNQIIK